MSSNASSNFSLPVHEAPFFLHDKNWIRVFRIASYALIFLFAATGNLLVISVVYKNKAMWKTINLFPTLPATDLDEFQGKAYCIVNLDLVFGAGSGEIYFKFVLIVLYAIPFIVTVALNFAIIITMRKREIPGNTVPEACSSHREKTNRKVIRMVLFVVAAFLLCWSLYFTLMVLRKNAIIL